MKKTVAVLVLLLALPAIAGDPCSFTDRERARWTQGDMMSWKIALAAYKMDNKTFPEAKTLEELRAAVEPKYIAQAPMKDAWGNAYAFEGDANDFRLVSAGADGKFDRESWGSPGKSDSYSGDAVAEGSARWLSRSWDLSK